MSNAAISIQYPHINHFKYKTLVKSTYKLKNHTITRKQPIRENQYQIRNLKTTLKAFAPSDIFVLNLENVLIDKHDKNKAYNGIKETLLYCDLPYYILSENDTKTAINIINNSLKIKEFSVDSLRLFSNCKNKYNALKKINMRPICQETKANLHYIDGNINDILNIKNHGDLFKWKFYLANWGIKNHEQIKIAEKENINILSLMEFSELLKWGILMGVDDGCEPTPEEVREQNQ